MTVLSSGDWPTILTITGILLTAGLSYMTLVAVQDREQSNPLAGMLRGLTAMAIGAFVTGLGAWTIADAWLRAV